MFPMGKNQIMLRLENLQDKYVDGSIQSFDFDVRSFAENFFSEVNGGLEKLSYINVMETSLTGNQPINEVRENKIHWATVDDETDSVNNFIDNETVSNDSEGFVVTL